MLYPAELRGRSARSLSVDRFKLNEFDLITPKKSNYPTLGEGHF